MVWIGLALLMATGTAVILAHKMGAARQNFWRISALAGLGACAIVPLSSFLLYAQASMAKEQQISLAGRPLPEIFMLNEMIAERELRIISDPTQPEEWLALAPAYRSAGRLDDAMRAYGTALDTGTYDAATRSEIIIERVATMLLLSHGQFTPSVREGIADALALTPDHQQAIFLKAMMLDQTGRMEDAHAAWIDFLRHHKQGDAAIMARKRLASLEATHASDVTPYDETSMQVVSEEEIAAAAALSPSQRETLIEQLVQSLAIRLENQPMDLVGWERLVQSYIVLDRPVDARTALRQAYGVFEGDEMALMRLQQLTQYVPAETP